MKKHFSVFLFVIVVNIGLNYSAAAWDDKVTHKDLSEYAADNSVLNSSSESYMKSLGYDGGLTEKFGWDKKTQSVLLWIREGSELEDLAPRWLNHFHNPLKRWADAGLGLWRSALLWAQDGNAQMDPETGNGDWSWQKTRSYYYSALTSESKTTREEGFAKTFRGLGQQMHLVQDMAVPAHVRSSPHVFNRWAEKCAA